MALGVYYTKQDCSLARALELVGERWTMLIMRDAFWGVRRFTDFAEHLDISKAVLTQRLSTLVTEGLLGRQPHGGRDEYVLTDRGRSLWPALYALSQWGEAHTAPEGGPRRLFLHAECGTRVDPTGHCATCRRTPGPDELEIHPGPGADFTVRDDPVSRALRTPHRLLEPLDTRTH
ncbi:transcriptional regulator [Nocardia panacis]|uniref:Transcriptional regulator n=1 Tax=Nocardia panacis TaxID=2340916 RepID=A0A3A4KF45_9NOCA|nr:helix-turn-helix domain-containing protein [Nocardia panacis]RJO77569.1 transcriptional regulator [Nocardia panacis]